jgi:hypothetical protein
MTRRRRCLLFTSLAVAFLKLQAQIYPKEAVDAVVETGKLLVVVKGRVKGDETYRMTRRGNSV